MKLKAGGYQSGAVTCDVTIVDGRAIGELYLNVESNNSKKFNVKVTNNRFKVNVGESGASIPFKVNTSKM